MKKLLLGLLFVAPLSFSTEKTEAEVRQEKIENQKRRVRLEFSSRLYSNLQSACSCISFISSCKGIFGEYSNHPNSIFGNHSYLAQRGFFLLCIPTLFSIAGAKLEQWEKEYKIDIDALK